MAWWDEVKAKYRPSNSSPSDEEIREILDDPDVSDETKRELIAAWNYDYATGYVPADIFAQERTGYDADAVPDEVKDYIEEYGAQDYVDNYAANIASGALPGSGNPSADMKASAANAESDRRYAEDVEEHQENGRKLQSYADNVRATGRTGAGSSREIFDSGEIGLDFFRMFWGKYCRYRNSGGGNGVRRVSTRNDNSAGAAYGFGTVTGNSWTDLWVFKGRYNEQREVEFGRIAAEIDRYTRAVDDLQRYLDEVTAAQSDLREGEAADAAVERARALRDELTVVCTVLGEVLCGLEQLCLSKARTVHGLFEATIGGVGPSIVGQVVAVAIGGASDEEILSVASRFGIAADQECLTISDDVKAEVRQSAAQWCDTNLVPVVETKFDAFWDVCDATDEGFTEILDAMAQEPLA